MRVLAVYSGGLDSTVLLSYLREDPKNKVSAVSFDYGQRHYCELDAAATICAYLGVPHSVVSIASAVSVFRGSSQTDLSVAVPHGHYAEESMRATVVPNRNMLMLSLATAKAISEGADAVAYAAHAGDHSVYPDCRPEFVEAMRRALSICDYRPVDLLAPFVGATKADIVRLGHRLGSPMRLSWSCYEGGQEVKGDLHCGKCGTCTERKEAFALAGVVDETRYAD